MGLQSPRGDRWDCSPYECTYFFVPLCHSQPNVKRGSLFHCVEEILPAITSRSLAFAFLYNGVLGSEPIVHAIKSAQTISPYIHMYLVTCLP